MRYSLQKILLMVVAGCVAASICAPRLVAQNVLKLDFNSDPEELGIEFFGTAEWREDGGVNDTGYLSVTDAMNGQSGAIVFPDLSSPPGSALESFRITADLRVGGGTTNPADGFSFNLVRPEDPLASGNLTYAGIQTEGSLPEEGSRTGLGIGFDEWQSGPEGANPVKDGDLADLTCGDWQVADPRDCIGMSIRVDGVLLEQVPFPVQNGELSDQRSLQTGEAGADPEDLGWAELVIQVTPDLVDETQSNILISYKDRTVFNNTLPYRTSPGQLVFGGRTGNANSNHHIDNISIITDFTRIDPLGDFNEDGVIDLTDFTVLADNMNSVPNASDPLEIYKLGDMDFNGKVDLADFVIFRTEFAKQGAAAAAAIPEPTAAILAFFGLLGVAGFRGRRVLKPSTVT